MKPLPQSSPSGYVSGSGIQTDFDTDPVDQGGANLQTVSQVVENTPSTGPSSIVQRSCDSSFYLYLEGDAIRVGYQIDEPMLTQFGGVTVTPANTEAEYFATKQVGWLFGCPVTRAKWRRRWLCSAPPKGTNIPVIRMPIVGA
jgi:hypothetical protein